jgi:Tol biopolymer transport system component
MRTRLILAAALAALAATPAAARASSDDQSIAFARQLPAGGAEVFIAAPDGAHARQVPLPYPAEDWALPRWSPDRRQLLISHMLRFDAAGNLLPFRPAIVRPDGSRFRLLEQPAAPFDQDCQTWSPTGERILCGMGADPNGVFSLRAADGLAPARLTAAPAPDCCDAATDTSPDGRWFVFFRVQHETADQPERMALFVERLDGTGLRQLTPYGFAQPHEVASARWSPDGRWIISSTTSGQLFAIHPDGSGLHTIPLRIAGDYFAFQPGFSPDGRQIVFCAVVGGQEDIYIARAGGGPVRQVTDTPDFEDGPDWGRAR